MTDARSTTLGMVGKWGSGGTPKSTEPSYYSGNIPWIRSGDLPDGPVLEHALSITQRGLDSSSAKWVPAGALLIALYGATIGKLGITTYPVTTNQAVAYCVPDKALTSAEYLFWYLLSARPELVALAQGGAQPNISQTLLKSCSLVLPSLREQGRIVAKLQSLFRRSKNAREELAHIPRLVQRYRGAALAAAFCGDLTEEWRLKNGTSVDGNWRQTTIEAVSIDVRYGTATKCHYEPKKTPVLRIPNVTNGSIDLSDLKYGSFSKEEQEKLALKAGDLLVIRSNGSLDLVGRAALVPKSVAGHLYAGYLIRIRLDSKQVYPLFVQYAFDEPSIRQHIEGLAKSTSGVNNINGQQLKAITLKIPPLDEQKEIVEKIQSAFSSIDHLRDEAIRADKLLDRLDQATLAKAFRGERVSSESIPSTSLKGRQKAAKQRAREALGRFNRQTIYRQAWQ
jgi:type I restriction enzyme S subunit